MTSDQMMKGTDDMDDTDHIKAQEAERGKGAQEKDDWVWWWKCSACYKGWTTPKMPRTPKCPLCGKRGWFVMKAPITTTGFEAYPLQQPKKVSELWRHWMDRCWAGGGWLERLGQAVVIVVVIIAAIATLIGFAARLTEAWEGNAEPEDQEIWRAQAK